MYPPYKNISFLRTVTILLIISQVPNTVSFT